MRHCDKNNWNNFKQEGKTQISHPSKQSYKGAARIMLLYNFH